METAPSLTALSDEELLRRLDDLLRHSRRAEASLVAHIGEVDARQLYAREAAPSMFAYCTERLHLSEAEAYLRIAAARASREHPVLLTMLADGRLHLSAIAKLAPHLTVANRETILERAAHRTKREIAGLVAELVPRPDAPALIRKLPARAAPPVASRSQGPGRLAPAVELRLDGVAGTDLERRPAGVDPPDLERPSVGADRSYPERGPVGDGADPGASRDGGAGVTGRLRLDGVARPGPAACPGGAAGELRLEVGQTIPAPPATVEPLSPGRYKVQFTASAALRDKLERLRALMRTKVPDGDLAAILDEAVSEKLERLEARRFAKVKTPRAEVADRPTSPRGRRIPAAVRRAVHERDGGRCRFTDEQGRRCTAREGLEFHHRHPFGFGGDHSVRNIMLACALHNRHLAEADYGREAMARHRRPRRGLGDLAASPSP